MATVRLQRRIHRPPRRRLRAAGNGPRTRGHALPAPRPWRHRAPGLKRGDPEMPPPPPAGRERGSPPPPRAPAWHLTSSAAKVSPRGAERQKPLPKVARTSGGPARVALRPQPPRAPAGPARAHAALCFPSSRALPTCSIRMWGRLPGARYLTTTPRRLQTPRPESPEPCPAALPSAAGPSHLSFAPSWMRNARAPAASWRLSLCFLNWQDAIIGKSHCPAGRPGSTAPAPRRRPGAGRSGENQVAAPSTWSVTFGTKSSVLRSSLAPLGADAAAASIAQSAGSDWPS